MSAAAAPLVSPTASAKALEFLKPGILKEGQLVTPPAEPAKETPAEPPAETPAEPPVEKKQDAPAKVETPKKSPEESWKELRAKAEAAERERDEYRQRVEAEQARLKALEEELTTYKAQPAAKDLEERAKKAEELLQHTRKELASAALERDPGFRAQYDDQISAGAREMFNSMVAGGVPEAEAHSIISTWNKEAIAQRIEELPPVQKMDALASLQEINRLDRERRTKIANAEAEWQSRAKAQEEEGKRQVEAMQRQLFLERDNVLNDIFNQEGLRGNTDLRKATQEIIDQSFQYTPKQFMQAVANAHLMARAVQDKDARITELQAKLDQLEKDVQDKSAFIKNQSEATPRIAGGTSEQPEDRKAIALALLNPKVK